MQCVDCHVLRWCSQRMWKSLKMYILHRVHSHIHPSLSAGNLVLYRYAFVTDTSVVTCVFSLFGILVLGKTKYLALNPSLQDQLSWFSISVLHTVHVCDVYPGTRFIQGRRSFELFRSTRQNKQRNTRRTHQQTFLKHTDFRWVMESQVSTSSFSKR